MKTNCLLFMLLFTLYVGGSLSAQQSLLSADPNGISYKKALKLAKDAQAPVLAILYSADQPGDSQNEFSDLLGTISEVGYISLVIDWYRSPNKDPQQKIIDKGNPLWLIVHYDGAILSAYKEVRTDQQLLSVLQEGKEAFTKVEQAYQKASSRGDAKNKLLYAHEISSSFDEIRAKEVLDDYLKRVNQKTISDEDLKMIVDIGSKGAPSKRLAKLTSVYKDRIIRNGRKKEALTILERDILRDMRARNLLEPYYVWQRYEEDLGPDADSLYRRFAINYLSTPPVDRQLLYNEIYDYLVIYPDSPWPYLDYLYAYIIPQTSKKADLEELLEMMSYQVSKDSNYRTLDYKAYLLYKLGYKERALSMMSDIVEDAKVKGVTYTSLLTSIK